MRLTSRASSAATAAATARKVLPVPAGPILKVIVWRLDRVQVALLVDGLGRDPDVPVRPDHVLDDRRRGLAGVQRAGHGIDRRGGQHVAALDEPHELVDDVRRGADVALVAVQRQDVPAQEHVAAEALLQLARTESSEPASSAATSLSRVSWRRAISGSAEPLPDGGADALAVGASTGLSIATPMALPMSCIPVAPDSATASSTTCASSSSESSAGRYSEISWASASSAVARLVAAAAVRLGGLQAALALPAEHGDLVVAARLQVLLKRVGDQPQGADAVALARLHRRSGVGLDPLEGARPYRG